MARKRTAAGPINEAGIRLLGPADHRGYQIADVDLNMLLPDKDENPRITPQANKTETILAIARKNQSEFLTLGRKIVEAGGLNPGELLHVAQTRQGLVVKEGNRRIAALMVLENPLLLDADPGISSARKKQWRELAASAAAMAIPKQVRVIIGKNHRPWMELRHLGLQKGAGKKDWDTQDKARFDGGARPMATFAERLLAGLAKIKPEVFEPLGRPDRGFSTFERLVTSTAGRDHIGIVEGTGGAVRLRDGERSLARLEQVLIDLHVQGRNKPLTSRKINTDADTKAYMDGIEKRVSGVKKTPLLVLEPTAQGPTTRPSPAKPSQRPRPHQWPRQRQAKLTLIQEDLRSAIKRGRTHSALILTRVLVELMVEEYGARHSLPWKAKRDPALLAQKAALLAEARRVGLVIPQEVLYALGSVASKGIPLLTRLTDVIFHLAEQTSYERREAEAKVSEITREATLTILNSAVHRIEVSPTQRTVADAIGVLLPVLHRMADY